MRANTSTERTELFYKLINAKSGLLNLTYTKAILVCEAILVGIAYYC